MVYHIFVSGRVQGVGYRRFAQKNAEALSLQGWTRNLQDGRVEIVASGAERELDELCERLRKGPAFCQITDVVVKATTEESAEAKLTGFEIRSDAGTT